MATKELTGRRYVRRRRSRLEIAVEVLRACLEPNVPTRMMYATNTSWITFREILESLIAKGLVEKQETHKGRKRRDRRLVGFYLATDKGLRVVEQAEELQEALV